MKSNQKGSSMIEVLAVISIIGVLSVSAMTLIGRLFDRYKLTRAVDDIKALQKNVSARFSAIGYYTDLDEDILVEENVIPAAMVTGGKVIHSLGGKVKIEPASNELFYEVTFDGLSQKSCLELGNISWMINQSSELEELDINNYVWGWPCGKADQSRCPANSIKKTDDDALPVRQDVLADKCVAGTGNVIKWTFQ